MYAGQHEWSDKRAVYKLLLYICEGARGVGEGRGEEEVSVIRRDSQSAPFATAQQRVCVWVVVYVYL